MRKSPLVSTQAWARFLRPRAPASTFPHHPPAGPTGSWDAGKVRSEKPLVREGKLPISSAALLAALLLQQGGRLFQSRYALPRGRMRFTSIMLLTGHGAA